MVVQKKKPTKFTLLKKKSTTETSNEPISNIIEDQDNVLVTKPILKIKKDKVEEKEEKKKVIFQTEKNQTQLFNKTLKISDKPLVVPKVVKGSSITSIESVESTESISTESDNSNGSQKKSLTSTTKSTKKTAVSKKSEVSNKKKSSKVVEESVEKQPIRMSTPMKPISKEELLAMNSSSEEEEEELQPMNILNEKQEEEEEEEEEDSMKAEQLSKTTQQVSKVNKSNNSNKDNSIIGNNINKKDNSKSKKEEIISDSSSSDDSDIEVNNNKNKKNSNNTISGFNILPISIENSVFNKYIYIKKETSKKWPSNKTLFVTNLPSNCRTLEDIKKLFKYDYIESVHFGQPKPQEDQQQQFYDEEQVEKIDETTLHVAHIVMKDQDSLQLFLKKSHTLSIQQLSTNINGFDSMLNQYNSNVIQDYDALQEKLDNIMMDYDRRALETKKRSKQRQQPDADGFITVGPSSAKVMTAEEVKALMAKKDKKNFYAFQHRQQKKDELESLRKKFEEDKQKIAKITAARKFKPY